MSPPNAEMIYIQLGQSRWAMEKMVYKVYNPHTYIYIYITGQYNHIFSLNNQRLHFSLLRCEIIWCHCGPTLRIWASDYEVSSVLRASLAVGHEFPCWKQLGWPNEKHLWVNLRFWGDSRILNPKTIPGDNLFKQTIAQKSTLSSSMKYWHYIGWFFQGCHRKEAFHCP